MKNNFTGMFDALLERPTDHRQVISLSINEDAREAFQSLSGQKVRIKIEKYREKRSLDANAYFHVLVGKIADVIGISKNRCKNTLICRYGQMEILDDSPVVIHSNVPIEKMAEQQLLHCDPIDCYTDGDTEMVIYQVYRGSHTYDTKEMSILIDGTVQEAKDLDIETMPPDELERMIKVYEASYERSHG